MTETCVFCQIIAGEKEANRLEKLSLGFYAFEPTNPVTPGHTLIIPAAHITDATTDPAIAGLTLEHATRYARSRQHNLWPCNFITSAGAAASQTIFHLHIHIIPRAEYDGLRLPWIDEDPALGLLTKAIALQPTTNAAYLLSLQPTPNERELIHRLVNETDARA